MERRAGLLNAEHGHDEVEDAAALPFGSIGVGFDLEFGGAEIGTGGVGGIDEIVRDVGGESGLGGGEGARCVTEAEEGVEAGVSDFDVAGGALEEFDSGLVIGAGEADFEAGGVTVFEAFVR